MCHRTLVYRESIEGVSPRTSLVRHRTLVYRERFEGVSTRGLILVPPNTGVPQVDRRCFAERIVGVPPREYRRCVVERIVVVP